MSDTTYLITDEERRLAELPAEARAVKVRPELAPQSHRESYGEWRLAALTPEYRAWVKLAGVDWLASTHYRLLDREDTEADVVDTAILEWVDTSGQRVAFDAAMATRWA